jgi:hypothetical protein
MMILEDLNSILGNKQRWNQFKKTFLIIEALP